MHATVHFGGLEDLLELPDPFQHLQVFVIAEMHVVLSRMPRVEGMIANHVQSLSRYNHKEEWQKRNMS